MNLLANLPARLRSAFRRGREDAETREELRFHLEMETEKNLRAGMDPREARRRAHARLGGVEAVREAVRDARGMRPAEDLLRDLGYALRGACRNPGFTLAAVVSLAIPIGFNTTIFTIVDSLLFRPLPVVRPAELVDVYTNDPDGDRYSTSSYQDYLDSARRERRVHGHGRARTDVCGGPGGRDRGPGAGRSGDGQLLPVSRRSAGAGPDGRARGRSTRRRPGGRDLERAVGPGLRTGPGGRGPGASASGLSLYVVVGVAPPGFAGMLPVLGPDLWIPMTWIGDVARMTFGPGRDGSRTRRATRDVHQGKAPRRRHAGPGGRGPRRDHGRSGRRRPRGRRGPAGVVDPDGERAPAAGSGRPGLRRPAPWA